MAEYKNIMVYVETAEENPVKVGLEMLSPAKEHAEKVTAVVIGSGVADAAKKVAEAGADQVICVDSEDYKEYNLDAYAAVLTQLVKRRKSRSSIYRWNTRWKRHRTSSRSEIRCRMCI